MARGAAASTRADQVIDAGLGLYTQGDLVGALERWRQALEIDPENRRAREYVSYVEEHYEVLDRKLRGERPAPEPEEVGPTIEMEADDPMEEIDAYDSVEVSMPDVEAPSAQPIDVGAPTEEMAAPRLSSALARPEVDSDDDEMTGEATKAEGLAGLRRAAARKSTGPMPKPTKAKAVPVVDEALDEGWSLDGLEDALGPRDDTDTLEIASSPAALDDLSDLGSRVETHDPYAADEQEDEDEEPSAIQRPSDDQTGEVTRPERFPRADSARMRAGTRSTAPVSHDITSALRRAGHSTAPPSREVPRTEFDLADFDDPDAPGLGAVVTTRPPAAAPEAIDENGEVRVTFRHPRDSDAPRPGSADSDQRPTLRDKPMRPGTSPGEEEEATVDRERPGVPAVSFDDETYERPSLSVLADAASDLDAPYLADSDDLIRPGSEGDAAADASERETTQLYQRAMRPSKGAVSMELIAAELEADLDESVSLDPSLGDEAIKARVSWLLNRARSENQAGHFPVAVVAIDLALEQHPDSAVAQKLIHSNREVLHEVYRSFLGDMRAVPSLAMSMDRIPMHELDHRAAFLLSRIDGALTLEDVLDVSGMARLEALRHLCRLILRGFLELRP